MSQKQHQYRAILSSDWNECLAPCGPFDGMTFSYPELRNDFADIFRAYTGNRISLGEAAGRIRNLLPVPLTAEQMDAYLDHDFAVYKGVPDLIDWCRRNSVLFMVNTTGMVGYFQRALAKKLLPPIPVLSAHPMIQFAPCKTDPGHTLELFEIEDKSKNTATIVRACGIPPENVFIMGDSGGDGPHFKWGAANRAFLIGSMTKPALEEYCLKNKIRIDHHIGPNGTAQQNPNSQPKMQTDFMELSQILSSLLKKSV